MPSEEGRRSQLDCALVVGLSASAGGLALSAAGPAALATAIVLVALARRGAPMVALLGALAFAVGAARSSALVGAFERDRSVVVGAGRWPARCEVEGTITRSPVLLGEAMKIDVALSHADCPAARGTITLHVPRSIAPPLARGDAIVAVAQLAPGYRFWNEGTGEPRPVQARRGVLLSGGAEDLVVRRAGRGVPSSIDRVRELLRQRILATFPADTAAMARALVLGEDDLTSPDQRAFQRAGFGLA